MKKKRRTYLFYLEDIQQSMKRIAEYIDGYCYFDFIQDYKTIDAVIRNFEIIGEASKNLPMEIKEKYNNIPWAEMYLLNLFKVNLLNYA